MDINWKQFTTILFWYIVMYLAVVGQWDFKSLTVWVLGFDTRLILFNYNSNNLQSLIIN
jgi:hypothetical protein